MKTNVQNILKVVGFCLVALSSAAQQATLMLNEINPNISSSHDLIELVAVSGGSVNGFTVVQGISSTVVLATLPQVSVSAGDIIVVHLVPATATGAAPGSETASKSEYSNAMYSANYDNAWDFHGGTTGLTYSNRVILVKDSSGTIQDAVPFTNNGGAPAAFPGDVVTIQAQNLWNPADCGGSPCSYSTAPTVESIAVNWQGAGTSATGNSAQRQYYMDANGNSDWYSSPQPQTWGALNSGQVLSVGENDFPPKLSVSPNPVKSELRINSPGLEINAIEIYNMLGEKVYSKKLLSNNPEYVVIDITKLNSGIYYARVISGNEERFEKFIKQ